MVTNSQAGPGPSRPPVAERRRTELTAHGDSRTDDWYWLKDRDDPAVRALLEAENAYTASVTERLGPLHDAVYREIIERTRLSDISYPAPKGDWSYYLRTIEHNEHPIWCRRAATAPPPSPDPAVADPHEVVLIDENRLAEGHPYFAVGSTALDSHQDLLAYGADTSGGEVFAISVRDLSAGEDLSDRIEGAYYGVAVAGEQRVLFYTRPDTSMRPHQIWRHALGTPQDADVLVWQEDDEHFFLGVATTKDMSLIVCSAHSNVTAELRVIPADHPDTAPVVVAPRRHGVTYSIEHLRGDLFLLSNEHAENFELWRTPLADVGRERWELLLAEREDVRVEDLDVVAGHVLVSERGHATTSIRILSMAGARDKVLEAPPAGTIYLSQNIDIDADEVRFETTSQIQPHVLYSCDLKSGETAELWRQHTPGYDPSEYLTERRWAVSDDGTRVPLTLSWRKDRPAGPGPCLLYGYGAYEVSCDPSYSTYSPIHPLLDRGMLYCVAHVRGGGELGRHWYLDGKLANKPHSFEDMVACARLLVEEALTTPAELAMSGASAGGLLVGASLNLAPALFGTVVAKVPFVDCLTTMLDTSLPLSVIEQEEWGNPISSEELYHLIRSYSPYDNVPRATEHPKMLVTAGLNDPRVSYFEPLKWVQKLRDTDSGDGHQILLKTEMDAGHHGPSGRFRSWREHSFSLAFILEATGAFKSSDAGASRQAPVRGGKVSSSG
ncbi:MAG: S9 family peptidase [Acidimicrobiales bacterium]